MAIKTHEGWRPGQEYAAKTKLEPATPQSAKVSLGKANALSDKECIPRLIKLGGDVESLHRIQITAAQSMKTAGYGYTLHNACAATLRALLNEAGIPVKTTLGAGSLADRLSTERNWGRVALGKQQAGDVGVAQNNVHIYLVVETEGGDEMTIADNQAPTPHPRFATGKGKTPTAYFLRAPGQQLQVAAIEDMDQARSYPSVDQDTSNLREA